MIRFTQKQKIKTFFDPKQKSIKVIKSKTSYFGDKIKGIINKKSIIEK